MIYKWETDEERLARFMKISPRKKMEWLREMNESLQKVSTKRTRAIRQKLRDLIRRQDAAGGHGKAASAVVGTKRSGNNSVGVISERIRGIKKSAVRLAVEKVGL